MAGSCSTAAYQLPPLCMDMSVQSRQAATVLAIKSHCLSSSLQDHALPGSPSTAEATAVTAFPRMQPSLSSKASWHEQQAGIPWTVSAGVAMDAPVLKRNTTSINRKRTCEDNASSCAPGARPQPKWPPNHESEAFEAVATKKVQFSKTVNGCCLQKHYRNLHTPVMIPTNACLDGCRASSCQRRKSMQR